MEDIIFVAVISLLIGFLAGAIVTELKWIGNVKSLSPIGAFGRLFRVREVK